MELVGAALSTSIVSERRARVSAVIRTGSPVSRAIASTREAMLTASPMTLNEEPPCPADRPGDDLPGVDSDPDLEVARPAAVDDLRRLNRALDRPVGVVGDPLGRPEDREEPIADELIDMAPVAGDDRDDTLEELVQAGDDLVALASAAVVEKSWTSQKRSETSSSAPVGS